MAKLVSQEDDVMVQGEEYEEDDDILDNTEDVQVDRGSSGNTSKQKNPVVIVGIVAAVVILFVLCGVGAMKIMPMMSSNDENEEETEEYIADQFEYMITEIEELRENGYTGDEIESAEAEMIPSYMLIEEAQEKRKALYESEAAIYQDAASPEFKELENMTWVGGEEFTFDVSQVDTWQRKGSTLNLDYKKVPLHGYQCFIRIEMRKANPETGREAGYCYMFISPERYAELDDEGNINVQINYYFIEETKTSIITDIKEVRTTDN